MCKECTDRHVHCHGYGPKPTWMDGGPEEQKEKTRIKAAIKENFRRVKKMQGRARKRANDLSRSLSETLAPTQGDEGLHAVITPRSPPYSSLPDHERTISESSEDNINACAQDETVEVDAESSPRSLEGNTNIDSQEAWLLMHYLDQVFPWQFPYHDSRSRLGNRGWLFSLLMKRGPLYHAVLSLASLLQSAMIGTEEEFQRKQSAWDHHSRALRELCDLMSEKGDKLRENHTELAEFLTCSFIGAEHDWLVHLDAATSVMNLLSAEAIFNPTLHDRNNNPSPLIENLQLIKGSVKDGLEFLLVIVIWFDLFACLPTGRAPQLPYHRWLQIPGLNTADLMGCHNWVMEMIGDIAQFSIWKETQEKDGILSIRELANKGQGIETRLENGIQSLDLARSVRS
ncbi:C6 transcription factor [Penicillium cosmopolitanum]|uniref:C6 transcription factor n=1 Tax=Penicillium cosmopolitanum TaxID=1131564 RepID=A0A9W9W535_9EURO|nr:C6 transcription factor [Penicillium cosmopolitanum]KAJ5403605.1 C6 transcription factor [Penicillium cosmopolitanum]